MEPAELNSSVGIVNESVNDRCLFVEFVEAISSWSVDKKKSRDAHLSTFHRMSVNK